MFGIALVMVRIGTNPPAAIAVRPYLRAALTFIDPHRGDAHINAALTGLTTGRRR